jgi:hypothetical protein
MGHGPRKFKKTRVLGSKNSRKLCVLGPQRFICISKELSLIHMEEAPFPFKCKPIYIEHNKLYFKSKKMRDKDDIEGYAMNL